MAFENTESAGGATKHFVTLYKGYWGKRVDDEGKWGELSSEMQAQRTEKLTADGMVRREPIQLEQRGKCALH